MKLISKFLMRVTSGLILIMILMISFPSILFAENPIMYINQDKSLVDVIGLEDNEETQVIVEFTSPSLLELDIEAGSSDGFKHEQELLRLQDEILKKLDINPDYRYTSIINGVGITASGKEIRELEKMNGVKDVYLSETFKAQDFDEYHEQAILSQDMMGISKTLSNEYTGDGVLVAVLDSGITFEHEAFNNTKYVQNPALTSEDIIKLGYSAPAGYYNPKIPFYCDYTGTDSNFFDFSGHGSHVAGLIAGYAENADGSVKFSGIAPGAQICALRVLNETGGGTDQIIIAALEDAYKLGVDIINISFGRDSSFRLGGNANVAYGGIYENLEEAGVVVVCSAGNLGSMAENTPRHVLDENCVDYGTLSLPAIYPGNIGVGSINGSFYYTQAFVIDGQNYLYSDNQDSSSPLNFKNALNGQTVEVVFNNYGKQEDYVGVDVNGKVVAVKRGELSFTDKCQYAAEAGAIGLIVINGATDAMGGMVINNQSIPAILVENNVINHFPISNLLINLDYGMVEIPDGGELSYFSAVGVTPDLEIGLDILGVGGKVTSVKSNTKDEYISYSGTSMAAPTVAGTYAVLYQIYKEDEVNKEKSRADLTSYMEDVTQSTATILTDDLGNKYSPRFQGAGFIDFEKAIEAKAYIRTPLVCLGYDKESSGSISVQYELINVSNTDINYQVVVSAIIDDFRQITPTDYKNNVTPRMLPSSMYSYSLSVDGVAITNDETITLKALETMTVKLELTLSEEILSKLAAAFPYGYFLDGFIEFYDVTDLSEPAIHGGYVSFVGDWLLAPALEPLTQADVMDWINSIGKEIDDLLQYFAAGHINGNYNYLSMLVGNQEYYIGENPLNDGAYIPSFDDRNAISAVISNADEIIYDSLYITPSLLRSCKSLRYVVSNSETNEVYATSTENYVIKDIPVGDYLYFGLSNFEFDASYIAPNEQGQVVEQYIPSGTNVTISIYTTLDHPDATERLEAEYSITIDYTAPKLYYDYDADSKTLTIKSYDSEYLAGILLEEVDDSYNIGNKFDSRIFADQTPGVEHIEVFDLTNYDKDTISITVSDYASNMVSVILSLEDGNISNMESDIETNDDINVEFKDNPYLYQDVEFVVTPNDGYCFTEDFKVFVNDKELVPSSIVDGAYYYIVTVTDTKLEITTEGVLPHNFISVVTKEPTCTCCGTMSMVCDNCGLVHDTQSIEPNGHKPGEPVIMKEATDDELGVSVIKCDECGEIQEVIIIPQLEDKPVDNYENDAIQINCGTMGYVSSFVAAACLFLMLFKKRSN